MSGKLQGKTALITGGGSGIGEAIAKRFVAEGAKVVITGRRAAQLETVAAALPSGTCVPFAGDVGVIEDAQGMVEAAIALGGGKLDILVNNAAIDPAGSVVDVPVEQWLRVINTNLNGPFYTMRAAIPNMIANGGGSIVNIASLAALRCIPAMPAYSAAKSGLIGLSNAAALDYGPQGIRVNVVAPGATRTVMLENQMKALAETLDTDVTGALAYMTKFNPLRRPALPDEITGAVVFFASDDSAIITGTVLPVDAGACVVDPNGAAVSSGGINWGGAK
ncbi:MAG: SDR family oxidoreductase [Oscillospiraceae bacterium]|jgi:NAD(P)-dependent dehydrogenase (short-subunit alcohol dehydrogenase family)|nr:SDR family oxidoreductase [Oscillospiraceae bacterium]